MSPRTGFPVCIAICLVLLGACSLQCQAWRNTEGRHRRQLQQAAVEGNRFEGVESTRPSNLERDVGLPVQTAASESLHRASAGPSGTSLSTAITAKATLKTLLGIHSLLGDQSLDVYTTAIPGVEDSEKQLVSRGPNKELDENASHKSQPATVVTAPNPSIKGDVLGSTTGETVEGMNGRPQFASTGILSDDGGFMPSTPDKEISADRSHTPQLTAEDLPSLLPTAALCASSLPLESQFAGAAHRSNGDGLSTSTGTSAMMDPTLSHTDDILNVDISTSQGRLKAMPTSAVAVVTVPSQSDDWDDTKVESADRVNALQPVPVVQQQMVTEPYLAAGGEEEEDDVKKALPPRLSATVAKGSQNMQLGSDKASVQGEEWLTVSTSQKPVYATNPSVKDEAPGESTVQESDGIMTSHSGAFPETATTTDMTKSDAFQTLRGVTPKEATTTHEIDVVRPAVTPGYLTTQVARGEGAVVEEERELITQRPTMSSATQLLQESEGAAVAMVPPATHFPVIKTPNTEGIAAAVSQEDVASVAGAPVTLVGLRMQTEEILGTTVAPTAPPSLTSPARKPTAPAAHRITTAATYGLDRLESEEEEEEEEEEEPDDEEDDEEDDEDDDDQDTNSMDESLDGDIDLSSFTVPGETSQEPLEDLENPAGELSYQVPSTLEWEQQNQGLVRSWMEKLKDKAGYMSGMLVPVGVGIAGALFILGALYSIKFMNRRRRNGFKRHKRKQREFNSMQDRVMLLADSSEDEF